MLGADPSSIRFMRNRLNINHVSILFGNYLSMMMKRESNASDSKADLIWTILKVAALAVLLMLSAIFSG